MANPRPDRNVGKIGGGNQKGRRQESPVTVGTSNTPFAKASSVSARSKQTGERSGINRDTIQGTNKRAKANRAKPNTVSY